MRPTGRGMRRLTGDKLENREVGPSPVAWSSDGKRLLANFLRGRVIDGRVSEAITVNPASGRVRRVDRANRYVFGYGLSADGRTILAGSLDGIVTFPYDGGSPTLIARQGAAPDWTR